MAKKTLSSVEERDIPKMTIENWVLAIIYDKDERRPRDALGLMDEVFIFMKELLPSIEPEFGFKCNCCGPYSENVANSVKQLLSTNMLEMKENESTSPQSYRVRFVVKDDFSVPEDEESLFRQFLHERGTSFREYLSSNSCTKDVIKFHFRTWQFERKRISEK